MEKIIEGYELLISLLEALYEGKKLRYTTGEFIILGKGGGKWPPNIWCGGRHRLHRKERLGAHNLSSTLLAQPEEFTIFEETVVSSKTACCQCYHHQLIPVVWGLVEAETGCPGEFCEDNVLLLEQEDRGEVYLGGCVSDSFVIDRQEPTHWCKHCLEFRLIKNEVCYA